MAKNKEKNIHAKNYEISLNNRPLSDRKVLKSCSSIYWIIQCKALWTDVDQHVKALYAKHYVTH